MSYLYDFIVSLFTYFKSLLLIDFTGYSGQLPLQVVEMFGYVESFFKFLAVVFFVYLVYNFLIFVISLGGVKNE